MEFLVVAKAGLNQSLGQERLSGIWKRTLPDKARLFPHFDRKYTLVFLPIMQFLQLFLNFKPLYRILL